jgi:colanic acid/amylovoran biosynthesis protein
MKNRRILVLNQHGENRGDEAAMRAMIRGLSREMQDDLHGELEFDVVVQFRDKTLCIPFQQVVRLHPIVPSLLQGVGLGFYGFALAAGLRPRFLLGPETRLMIKAYEEADMIMSAPGGPYIGDIYASHEPVHWFYIWLGALHKKPMFLYAPSCGPFRKRLYNWFRKHIYRLFDTLCIREDRSVAYLQEFLGPEASVNLTADSAVQEHIEPFQRGEYFSGERAHFADKFIVAVTGMQYKYPDDPDPARQRAHFNEVMIQLLCHVHQQRDCHFIFLPQLCGKVHDDTTYHRWLGEQLPVGASWEMVPHHFNSDQHRKVFGMSDLCLASRYHPQIFSTSCGVPGVFPCYEHKQFAYLKAMGLEDYAFDIRKLDADLLVFKLDEVLENRDKLSEMLLQKIPTLRERSATTTRLAAQLYRERVQS